ncbi:DUF4231 domain-containing protein [Phenylobacterium sp.]|uniref:DUF4231 domain-containing protein n=1 Tax=Phenylobacterium sp. TaxID=1871053 RepID=UPI002F958FA1
MEAVLTALQAGVTAVHQQEANWYAPAPLRLAVVCALADGADQLVAEAGLAAGFELHAVLPFDRDLTRRDLVEAGSDGFGRLLARATRTLELPGTLADKEAAYAMAGRAIVAHSTVLIAVWDGLAARGPGGTAEVVAGALAAGTPVVHVPLQAHHPLRVLWRGFDPLGSHELDAAPSRPLGALPQVLTTVLAPPADPAERRALADYFAERQRRVRHRLEFHLLQWVTGVRALRRRDIKVPPYAQITAEEWSSFRARCATGEGVIAQLDELEAAYSWADGLAQHFAQFHRSGHVFNFVVGAASVLIALATLLWPAGKAPLAVTETLLILAIIANTRAGTASAWQRRWLDYRQLAERLRPLRSLSLLGIARPQVADNAHLRWTDWYSAAAWRAVGPPAGKLDGAGAAALAHALAEEELAPQVAYHRASAHRGEQLDHRLHIAGTWLFGLTLAGCIVLLASLALFPHWTKENAKLFVALSAGLPAVGTAIFGIRMQGDFSGTARRSLVTAAKLEAIAVEVRRGGPPGRQASLFETASAAMVSDLDQWRQEHAKHELMLP